MNKTYYKNRDKKYLATVDHRCDNLPHACTEYFDDISLARAASTMANYATQLDIFFQWIHNTEVITKETTLLTFADLETITSDDVTRFLHELKFKGNTNDTLRAYARAISAFYMHFIKKNKIKTNPVDGVMRPPHKKSPKIYMDTTDMNKALNTVVNNHGVPEHEAKYNETIQSKPRDLTILALLVDTGIRVSELVGMNIKDIDTVRCRFPVQRKGGQIDLVYFSDTTLSYLLEYIKMREKITDKSEQAFIVSLVGKNKGHRLSVRSVEILIKKIATNAGVTNAEKMTPHKLRHTCAMALLKETGNIALVQKQLGHKAITSTTVYAEADTSDLEAIRNSNLISKTTN